jgi:hypothetical protein
MAAKQTGKDLAIPRRARRGCGIERSAYSRLSATIGADHGKILEYERNQLFS